MNTSWLLAQASEGMPSAAPSGLGNVNPQSMSGLVNFSAILIIGPILLVLAMVIWLILNSPAGAPFFKALAEWAFNSKQYQRAARWYAKLHEMQELIEGPIYARKAAQSYELAGNLREAQRWYEKGDDWAKVGQLLMEAGNHTQALEVFKSHDLPARLAHCYEVLQNYLEAGLVYEEQLHNLHKAEVFYRKASSSQDIETQLKAKLMLARIYHKLERQEDAQNFFDEVSRVLNSSAQYQEFPELLELHRGVKEKLQL